jgi:hypothetical protein
MNEQEFWNIIEAMNFNTKGYKKAGLYLVEDSGLTVDQMNQVEQMAQSKVNELYKRLFNVESVSSDGYSDLIWQIVANGRLAFEKATVQSAQEMIDNNQYTESFSYAFNVLYDLQK